MLGRTLLGSLVLVTAIGCNAPPEGGSVVITPNPATAGDTLRIDITDATDPNGDEVTYLYSWERDGEPVDALRGEETVPSDQLGRGELWTVKVTPSDSKKFGLVLTDSLEIKNAPPRITSLSLQPTAPRGTDDVVATVATADADGDPVTVDFAWTVNGLPVSESGDRLTPGSFGGGDEIRVTATPNDGFDDGESVTSDSVEVSSGAPSITGVEITPSGRVTVDSVLTCVPVGWSDPDGDPPGYTFDWKRNGRSVSSSEVFAVSGSNVGDELICTVTPTDGELEGSPRSSAAVFVEEPGCGPVGLPTDPHSGLSFVPDQVAPSGGFAIDGSTGEARAWCDGDVEVPVHLDLLIYGADFAFTGDVADVCAVRLVPDAGVVPVEEHRFSAALTGPTVSYDHHGITLRAGEFSATDLIYEVSIGTVGSCLNRRYSGEWAGDFATLLESQDWGIYVGEMSSEIEAAFNDPANNDPDSDEDVYDLHRAGYMIGASQMAETVDTQVFFAAMAFEVDSTDWTLVPDGGADYTRIRASTAVPGTTPPTQAVYTLNSYLYVWNAAPLLLGG